MAQPLFFTEVKIVDDGSIYQVVDVQNVDSKFSKPVDLYLSVGDDVAFELKRHLNAGNIIKISIADAKKGTHGQGKSLKIDDFTIVEVLALDQYKNQKKGRVNNIFTYALATTGGLVYFAAMQSFAVLASYGYFITNENREEKYLEIINTGDEDLIAALEEYLDAYDSITPLSSLYKSMKQAMVDIDAAANEGEVDAAVHMFETAV